MVGAGAHSVSATDFAKRELRGSDDVYLPTLVVMQSFVLASAGVMLIFAWAQNRAVSVLAIWGFANLLAAAGVLSLMFGATLRVPLCTAAGGVLLCTQSALIWKAARNIDGKRASWSLALVGAAAIIATGAVPLLRDFASAVGLAGGASYTAAVGLSVWAGRSDRLAARWALIGFAAVYSLSLWLGCVTTLTGSTGHDALPRLMSLFGFIYFEFTIFTLGSAFFAIAWIKERNEAVSLVAARTDALTGIANRAAILENGDRALQRCRHDAAPTSIVMFDLDRFKSINDQHGHAVGDAVLRKFCDVTVSLLRPQDLFGRLGGEEFTAHARLQHRSGLRPRRADPHDVCRRVPLYPRSAGESDRKRRRVGERDRGRDAGGTIRIGRHRALRSQG